MDWIVDFALKERDHEHSSHHLLGHDVLYINLTLVWLSAKWPDNRAYLAPCRQ